VLLHQRTIHVLMMEDTPTIAAVRRFLRLLLEGSPPTDEELARALDALAMAYHEAPEGSPADDDSEPPGDAFQPRHAELGKRFTGYGFYTVADPLEPVDQNCVASYAIDDLVDIARDLEEVVWRSENIGVDDAHWHFKFLYRTHWGRHLRELTYYLHAKMW
jgi:RimJ/RimL family protein N-acetyltransferase